MRNSKFYKILLLLFFFYSSFNGNAQSLVDGRYEGVLRVKFRPELTSQLGNVKSYDGSAIKLGISTLDNVYKAYNVTEMKRVFAYSPQNEEKHAKYGLHLWYQLNYSSKDELYNIIQSLQSTFEVEIAEGIYKKSVISGTPNYVNVIKQNQKAAEMPYNDPYLPKQWHYDNTGQTGGTPGADINLFEAWNITTGSSNVIVSIHDQGVEYDHEDLAGNMWINEAELNGQPNFDDDGNGYKDDVYGFNFADNMGEINPDYHGTHVAGTVSAVTNNGIGVAGVAGGSGNNDGVKIMSCQILGGVSQGNLPDSYIFAADNGAVISQNSWGYSSPGVIEQAILDGIDYFINEAGSHENSPMKGGVVLFAAGNSNYDADFYPGYYDNTISVSALDASNIKASYSNYGTWVDIAAPGGDAGNDSNIPEENQGEGYSNGIMSTLDKDRYGYLDGTSMACPHVSGIAALVVSQYGGTTFTAEMLKTHLLTGVVDVDNIAGNEDYIGKLGLGITDAVLALREDGKIAPNAITDLAITGLAQDFAIVEWNVPSDDDDGKPYGFEILYSKEAINGTTIEFAKKINNKNLNAVGELVSFEITGLDALTEYYFNVRSIDRWGNVSDFSNEITGTTNAGPEAWIDESNHDFETVYIGYDPITYVSFYDTIWYLPINIDVQANVAGQNEFYLHNSGEGVLRWDLIPRHIESIDAWDNSHINYPTENAPVSGHKIDITSVNAPMFPIQTFAQEDNNEVIDLLDPYSWSMWYVGETDTTFTNSAATHFRINSAEGFNMTHAEIFLNFESSKTNPAIFEIYLGEDISNAKLTYAQELTSTSTGWNYFNLEEQIFLEDGTDFWMVIHIPSGNLYPLGAGVEANPEDSKNCYVSLNMGKSWAMFEDLYYNNLLTWGMAAVSMYKTPGEIITLTPIDGEVVANDSVLVSASVNGSEMINGTYKTSVVINTNDVDDPTVRTKIKTIVSGQKAIIEGESIVEFGSVMFGKEKVIEVTLKNMGYGNFSSPGITISNPQFELIGWLSTINPRSDYTFQMIYKPTATGSANAKVTLSNWKGDEYIFNVFGVAVEPPVMEISPDSSAFLGLMIGDTISGEFYVKNTGNYPLNYYFPAFASGENVGEVSGDFCKFGYSAKENPGGIYSNPAYVWNDISATGTNLTGYSTERHFFFYDVDLAFNFPFFGKMENHVYITNYGMVSFDQNSTFNSSPMGYKNKSDYFPDRYIAALGIKHNLGVQGNIYYQDLGDRFIIQYDKMGYLTYDPFTWEEINLSLTYQIVLHANGNINIYYKDMGGADFTNDGIIAIENNSTDDGLCVTQSQYYSTQNYLPITDNTVVEFINPGLGLIYEMTNAEGLVQVGDSVKVTYSAKTEVLNVADYIEKIPILSNDPFNNPGIYTMYLNVTGGGVADMHLSDSVYNYGSVFQTDNVAFNLWVTNTSRANDDIVSAVFDNGNFTFTGDIPAVASPNRKLLYSIAAKTANLGTYEDTLRITTGTGEVLKLALFAEVIEAPQIASNIASITDTIVSGNTKNHVLTVTNNGGNDLDFAPIGNDWVTVSEPTTLKANVVPEYTYVFAKSTDENGPSYAWTDIVETGTRLGNLDNWGSALIDTLTFWSDGIELPFTFNFYGNEYDTLYIGAGGVMTFTEEAPDVYYAFGAGNIPNPNAPNNLIAPMFGFVYPDAIVYPDWGTYYQMFNDKVIVQWHRYTDGFFMGYGISYQAIIYPDGNIKFQYNFGGTTQSFMDGNSVIGLENEDGTEATLVSYNSLNVVKDGMAIAFNPIRKYTVAAGTSSDFDITINAKELYAGDYTHDLVLFNNTPDNGELTIPVQLNVTGTPNVTAPTAYDYGDVMIYEVADLWGTMGPKSYEYEFEIVNDGTDKMEIFSFDISKLTTIQVTSYQSSTDWFGNPIMQWVDVMNLPGMDWSTWPATPIPLYIEPGTTMKFRATIMPTVEGIVNDTVLIVNDFAAMDTLQITFSANAILPPDLSVSEDQISVYAEDKTVVENRTFYVSNKNGVSPLDYSLDLSFERGKEKKTVTTSTNKSISAIPTYQLLKKNIEGRIKRSKSSTKASRILEHENATVPEMTLGYGGSMSFYTATRFIAPSDGFNLTDVQTWYVPYNELDSKIIVEIYTGDPMIANANLVYSQEYHHIISAADNVGSFITITLDENQLMYPDEEFFIAFTYPIGATYPQGVASVTNAEANRFMYGDGDAWYDIVGSGYEYYGWMVKALEAEFVSSTWLSILSPVQGTIEAGDSLAIDLKFEASIANEITNSAVINVSSNDPVNIAEKVDAILVVNQSPSYSNIPTDTLFVNENETLLVNFEVADNEDDGFSCTLAANMYASLTFSSNVGQLTFTPDYDAAGVHNIELTAIDDFGNSNVSSFVISVLNVNRIPEAQTVADQTVERWKGVQTIALTDFFVDLDGDLVEFVGVELTSDIAELSIEGTEILINPIALGTGIVTVYATDNIGATSSNTFNLEVLVSNESFTANTVFSPNGDGINDTWTIENAGMYSSNSQITILNGYGQEVFSSFGYETPWDGTYNGKQLNVGTYYYIITFTDGTSISGTIALIK